MSDTEFLDNPTNVLNSIRKLMAEPTDVEDTVEATKPSEKSALTLDTKPAFAKDKGKKKFTPKGEGPSGLTRVPPLQVPGDQPRGTADPVLASEKKVLDLLQTPPGEEVEASYVDVPPFPELPPVGETSTPARYDEENEVWATKHEVQEIVETLDEFIKLEIKEALSPVLRDLKVLSADIKALSGASSALIQKVSSLQTKILNIERTKSATITSASQIAVAPVTRAGPVGETTSPSRGNTAGPSASSSPVARFLQSYPTYIETGILRKVRLTELARDMGYKGTLPAVGKTDWTEQKLTQKFSAGK
jgi:hypothetical protein